jgi:DNA-binding response OmpR family regulator
MATHWNSGPTGNAASASVREPDPRAKRILIIEDDEKIAFALSVRLGAHGYSTWIARDGALGLGMAVSNRPDLVLMDIGLPTGDGFSLAERIKSHISAAAPRFIFLTASKSPELRERAERLGAAAFFEKPYEAEALLAAVKQALTTPL